MSLVQERRSVILHQQAGALTLQEFAVREGLTLGQVKRCCRSGWILGARKDARSKHWSIYPPAKLMRRPKSYQRREAPAAHSTPSPITEGVAALRLPVHPTGSREGHAAGGILGGGRCTPTTEGKAEGIPPSASQQAPQGRAVVYRSPEAQSVLRILRESAARQFREGLHYLRLDAHEFAQLYAALDHERSRIRKLVSRGLVKVGELRASDSTWRKMQAMCKQGRIL